ncbi:MAG: glycine betaine/L-proline ABC transporter substrate-binding protein ProX [Symploca sp. SIO2D2]|nr:glycine betaine/L-proline ABC transporter substrate-binding protein ProX [Symploca sp. SIO2D2]
MSKFPLKPFQFGLLCLSVALMIILTVSTPSLSISANSSPIKIARPTWDTGWFQAEVLKLLLEDLGYEVKGPITRTTENFYRDAAQGDVDLWANSWLPNFEQYHEQPDVQDKVEAVGFIEKGGALQGYMVDKPSADRLDIKSIADFKDPKIAQEFDTDGNGKAELIGCNVDWSCAAAIEHHLEVYGLEDTVEQVQGDYSPLMSDAVAQYQQGQPLLFYNWTPNWTLGRLQPGKDTMWLEVPFPSLLDELAPLEKQTTIAQLPGCASEPCNIGFPPNDIRIVANTAFLEARPDVRKLLELLEIPLADIAAQNALMLAGEGENADIIRHAQTWIKDHRSQVTPWLRLAKDAAIDQGQANQTSPLEETEEAGGNEDLNAKVTQRPTLKVATQRFEPFVTYEQREYGGFSIELWEMIAEEMGVDYQLYGVNSIAKLLDDIEREEADVGITGINITSERERALDFSLPYYSTGLQILVPVNASGETPNLMTKILSAFISPKLYLGIGGFILVLLLIAHVIWWTERKHNSDFPQTYLPGIWEAFWWAAVTVTTVGYGDKTPKRFFGRVFGLIWMCAGYFVFAFFTASVATTFTIQELQGDINNLEDLFGRRVATVTHSSAVTYLQNQRMAAVEYDTKEDAFLALQSEEVEAFVYDAPILEHYASHDGKGQTQVVGAVFDNLSYGLAVPLESPYRKEINVALLKLMEDGTYEQLRQKWFG